MGTCCDVSPAGEFGDARRTSLAAPPLQSRPHRGGRFIHPKCNAWELRRLLASHSELDNANHSPCRSALHPWPDYLTRKAHAEATCAVGGHAFGVSSTAAGFSRNNSADVRMRGDADAGWTSEISASLPTPRSLNRRAETRTRDSRLPTALL
jgi:hypothetical protein